MYKNFTGLVETVNSNLLCKLDGKDDGAAAGKNPDAAAKNPDAESSLSIRRYCYAAFIMFWQYSCTYIRANFTLLLFCHLGLISCSVGK